MLLFAVLLFPVSSGAQVMVGLSPTRGEHELDPGKSHTDAFIINNAGSSPTMVTISVSDWGMDDAGNVLFEKKGSRDDSASDWIKINPRNFILQPEDQKQVRYTVTIPEETADAGYRTAVRIRAAPADPSGDPSLPGSKQGRIEVHGEFIYYVYLVVGHPHPKGALKSFKADKTDSGVKTELVVKNTGNVHFRTKGFIQIRNEKDRLVAEKDVPSFPVLPEMTRTLSMEWAEEALSSGTYFLQLRLDIGRKELLGEEVTLEIRDGP
ncbi:MAG TPA: hypothetical protein VIU33_06820 [Nitrospiria bacterium]